MPLGNPLPAAARPAVLGSRVGRQLASPLLRPHHRLRHAKEARRRQASLLPCLTLDQRPHVRAGLTHRVKPKLRLKLRLKSRPKFKLPLKLELGLSPLLKPRLKLPLKLRHQIKPKLLCRRKPRLKLPPKLERRRKLRLKLQFKPRLKLRHRRRCRLKHRRSWTVVRGRRNPRKKCPLWEAQWVLEA